MGNVLEWKLVILTSSKRAAANDSFRFIIDFFGKQDPYPAALGVLPNIHINPSTTAWVYDRNMEVGSKGF